MNITMCKKFVICVASILAILSIAQVASARRYPVLKEPSWEKVKGGFELSGFVNAAYGWQKFSNDTITEIANDGSYAGPIGEWLPATSGGPPPSPGQEIGQFFIPRVELDIRKNFGDRARLVGDLQFGRATSGSSLPIPGINVVHAYGAVTLYKPKNVQLWIGRVGLQAGFEPYEDYFNDTVSYSVIWRGLIAPGNATGIQVTGDLNENLHYYFIVSNGTVNDSTFRLAQIPSFMSTWIVNWGPDAKQSGVVITPFAGPESDTNRHWSIGLDAYTYWWIVPEFQLGLEGTFQRDGATAGGPITYYGAALLNLHWEFAKNWYVVGKFAYGGQYNAGNGVLNLLGQQQNVFENTLCFGHRLTDTAKIKFEGRLDIVDPKGAAAQYVGGFAMSMNYAF